MYEIVLRYFMRAKIDAAAKMLRAGSSVTAAAMNLDFSSSRCFAAAFKRFTNRRPGSLLKSL
ncbi:MAG: helix-turn-helix domain-containing protein [Planctomycetes bacterium]|nr:helix-turn-helix domain-containing protein [Planctomycetota bacterium]